MIVKQNPLYGRPEEANNDLFDGSNQYFRMKVNLVDKLTSLVRIATATYQYQSTKARGNELCHQVP